MAERLKVQDICNDKQLIAYVIRDTVTPFCAVIALNITDLKSQQCVITQLEHCPCEVQWWLIAHKAKAQLSFVHSLCERFSGQVMLTKANQLDQDIDSHHLTNTEQLEHNEMLNLGHVLLTIKQINCEQEKVSLLTCDNTVFYLASKQSSLLFSVIASVMNNSGIKLDNFSSIYLPNFISVQGKQVSHITGWQLNECLTRHH